MRIILLCILVTATAAADGKRPLEMMRYEDSELIVDAGVGLWAWPLPMDYDGDGDFDLLVSCPDKPFNGLYWFENKSGEPWPVLEAPVRIGDALPNVQVSHTASGPVVLTPAHRWTVEQGVPLEKSRIFERDKLEEGKLRANQWKLVDWEGDGDDDLLVGVGNWTDYGWDNAYNEKGEWMRGPLHGRLYLLRQENGAYGEPEKLQAGGVDIDPFGMPSPCVADFDGDGDLDIICGEFIDGFTWYENTGTREQPEFATARALMLGEKPLEMDLCMIVSSAIDWDKDGHVDLVVGQEDGRVALVRHTGEVKDRMPVFEAPRFFRQRADLVKFGALVAPVSVDWDGDGDEDLICGNTAGYIGYIENQGTDARPRWAPPVYLEAGGEVFRIIAGPNGSIQGPAEEKWGYTTLSVADWDLDGRLDIVLNSIWGRVQWLRNTGEAGAPRLEAARTVEVQWEGAAQKPAWNWWDPAGRELVTQWRTTPVVVDWTQDGLPDLVMLDHEGYLCLYPRERGIDGELQLHPPRRVFVDASGEPLQLNAGQAGRSGRRKMCAVDWDKDGLMDILIDSKNIDWLRQVKSEEGRYYLENMGQLADEILAGHDTSPTTVDRNGDGVPELLIGAEDGHFYYQPR